MPSEPPALTPEQRAVLAALAGKFQQLATALVQGVAAVLPVLAAAAETLKDQSFDPQAQREVLDLPGLKAALSDGASALPPARFDREGKWRWEPSAN